MVKTMDPILFLPIGGRRNGAPILNTYRSLEPAGGSSSPPVLNKFSTLGLSSSDQVQTHALLWDGEGVGLCLYRAANVRRFEFYGG